MSGVNIGSQVTFIITNLIFGLSTGASVLVAQYLGRGEREKMLRTISTIITGLFIAAAVITPIGILLRNKILILIETPPESFTEAESYLLVTLLGVIFIFGYNALSAILRGMGDSKRPFIFIVIACITNVILDIIFVGPFKMGAMGAAIATVIAQALSMFLCVAYLIKNNFIFDFKLSSFRIYKEELLLILKIGTPTAIQNSVVSISFLFITTLVNSIGGVSASAAVGVVSKFNGFAIMPAVAMGAAISTMTAQNLGAGKPERALAACKIGTIAAISISIVIFVLAQLFPAQILSVFDRDPKMIADGVSYMKTFSLDYLIVPFVFCLNGMFTGSGHTLFSFFTSAASSILFRIPASYLFGVLINMGLTGVGLGGPTASLGSLIIILIFFFSGKWKENKVINDKPASDS